MADEIGTKVSQLPLGENLADDDLMYAVEDGVSKKVEVGYLKEVFDGGSDVSITPSIGSGTKVADYEIDGVAGAIYVPTAPTALSQLSDDSTHRLVTDTEKNTWNGKQNALTFDDVPTDGSNNPVKSGGVYSVIKTVNDDLDEVKDAVITTIKSKNLFDLSALDYDHNVSASDGSISDVADPSSNTTPITPFIELENATGKYLVVSGKYNGNPTSRQVLMAFYKADKTYIGYYNNKSSQAIPQDAKYVVIRINSAFTVSPNTDVQVEITSDGNYTSYEAYFEPYYTNALAPQVLSNTEDIAELRTDVETSKVWKNVPTSSDDLLKGRIVATTGEIEISGTAYSHIATTVSAGDLVYFFSCTTGNTGNYGYAFYDSNGVYISGVPITEEKYTVAIAPTNAATFKYGMNTPYWSQEKYNTIKVISSYNAALLDNVVNYDNNLAAYTWNAVGDSITQNGYYMAEAKNALNLPYNNMGVASSTIAVNNTYLQDQSIVERVCGLNGNTAYSDADIWTINGGLNDVLYKSTLGTLAATGSAFDNTTVYGALQSIVENIMNRRAQPRLVLVTPTHSVRDTWSKDTYGITINEVRQAMIDVGAYYGVPVLDMWALGGINAFNMQKQTNPTTSDGVHPNTTGAKLMAMPIVQAIKEQFYDK